MGYQRRVHGKILKKYNQMSSPPAWGMGTGAKGTVSRHDRDHKNTGPGTYNLTMADKKKEAAFSMGAKLKNQEGTYHKSPGAGTYNPPSKVVESPGKSFSKKLYSSHY